ncbi:MAG: NlpC/P60 family protein [Saprospiraceae bacterium]|nr:C40 family peptidase [Saprospiraceae bacterium]MDW8229649.1 NlpC/P60 family protein [Saprospiraceae bacterium]
MPHSRVLRLCAGGLLLGLLALACTPARKAVSPSRVPPSNASEARLRQEIVRYALQLRGISYRYAGREPSTGFDCSGFTSHVLRQFNITVSPASALQAREGSPVPLNQVQPGDIIVFGKNARHIQHVALVVENRPEGIIVVHSTSTRGVVSENITTSSYWKPRILEARNVIGPR